MAIPISSNDVCGSRDKRTETGIRIRKAEEMPWIITGMLFPHPLKYPILLKRKQVRMQSAENPFRKSALCLITSASSVNREDIRLPPKNPAKKIKIPTVTPINMAVK